MQKFTIADISDIHGCQTKK